MPERSGMFLLAGLWAEHEETIKTHGNYHSKMDFGAGMGKGAIETIMDSPLISRDRHVAPTSHIDVRGPDDAVTREIMDLDGGVHWKAGKAAAKLISSQDNKIWGAIHYAIVLDKGQDPE